MLSQMAENGRNKFCAFDVVVVGWTDVNSIHFIKQKQQPVLCERDLFFRYYISNVEFDFKLSLKLFPLGCFLSGQNS